MTGTKDDIYGFYHARLEVQRASDKKWLMVASAGDDGQIPYARLPDDKITELRLIATRDQDRLSFIAIRELILTASNGRSSLRQIRPEERLGTVLPPD